MFDIGFWELSLIFVVALIVLGPERLPRAARTAGLWMGRARSVLSSVKADIDRELKAEELKAMMKKRASMPELEEAVREANQTVEFDSDATPEAAAKTAPAADSAGADKSKSTSGTAE